MWQKVNEKYRSAAGCGVDSGSTGQAWKRPHAYFALVLYFQKSRVTNYRTEVYCEVELLLVKKNQVDKT